MYSSWPFCLRRLAEVPLSPAVWLYSLWSSSLLMSEANFLVCRNEPLRTGGLCFIYPVSQGPALSLRLNKHLLNEPNNVFSLLLACLKPVYQKSSGLISTADEPLSKQAAGNSSQRSLWKLQALTGKHNSKCFLAFCGLKSSSLGSSIIFSNGERLDEGLGKKKRESKYNLFCNRF